MPRPRTMTLPNEPRKKFSASYFCPYDQKNRGDQRRGHRRSAISWLSFSAGQAPRRISRRASSFPSSPNPQQKRQDEHSSSSRAGTSTALLKPRCCLGRGACGQREKWASTRTARRGGKIRRRRRSLRQEGRECDGMRGTAGSTAGLQSWAQLRREGAHLIRCRKPAGCRREGRARSPRGHPRFPCLQRGRDSQGRLQTCILQPSAAATSRTDVGLPHL